MSEAAKVKIFDKLAAFVKSKLAPKKSTRLSGLFESKLKSAADFDAKLKIIKNLSKF